MTSALGETSPTLGRVISRHHGRILAGGWLLYVGGLLVVGAVMALVKGQAGTDRLGFLAGLAAGVLLLLVSFLKWQQSVTLYEGGFTWTRLLLGTRTVRWDEVADVRAAQIYSRQTGRSYRLEVDTRTGGRLVLTGAVAHVEQLHAYLVSSLRGRHG